MTLTQRRADFLVAHLRSHPDSMHPEDALAMAIWPTPEFERHFQAKMVEGVCLGCYGSLDEFKVGCRTCMNRRTGRRRLERRRLARAAA